MLFGRSELTKKAEKLARQIWARILCMQRQLLEIFLVDAPFVGPVIYQSSKTNLFTLFKFYGRQPHPVTVRDTDIAHFKTNAFGSQ